MKKICFLLALLMIFSCLMISCKDPKKNPTPTTSANNSNQGGNNPPANPDAFDFTNVTVTRPKGSAQSLFSASKQVNVTYNNLTGKNLSIKDDLRAAEAGEILVGLTNRPESATAKSKLPAGERFAYAILRVENKIAIVGTTDEMTVMGVNYFVNTILKANIAENGKLNIAKDFLYTATAEGVSLLNSNTYRFVVARALKDITGTAANKMAATIKTLTEKEGRVSTDSKGKGEDRNTNPEILVGATYYPETIQVMSSFGYNEYGIAVVGKKVVVFGFSTETLDAAVQLFELVAKNNLYNGQLILPDGMLIKLSMTGATSALQIPAYPAVLQSFVDAGEGGTLIRSSETTAEEFQAYGKALANEGFTLLSQHTAGENIFFTYYKENLTVTCNYHPTNQTADLIVDNEKNRPTSAAENQYTPITTTLFTQMGLNYIAVDAGMGYIMRLADGRFIVIDGGMDEYEDHKKLFEIIRDQHNETGKGGKPVIAAWFLTHAHSDHYSNFQKFMSSYCPLYVTLESVVWNMGTTDTNPELQSIASGIRSFFKNNYQNIHIYYARTGQRYHIANVTVDVLFTPDDYGTKSVGSQNDSSCYFKITETVSGQTIMITGDSEAGAAAYMVNRYKNGGLASDIMQQAHHGYWAGSVALYKLINPEIVFWPCPSRWYYALYDGSYGTPSNKWITLESTKVKQIILAGNGNYTITMPHTAIASKPHTTSIKYDDGAVIFHQDFENCQLYNTGIGVVDTNGRDPGSNYTPTNFQLVEHGRQMSIHWHGGKYSVMRIATPDMVRGNNIVTLTMDIDLVKLGDGFSIWFNDKTIQNVDNRALYTLDKTGSMEVAIEINRTTRTYTVYINGSVYAQGTSASNDAGFIALLSQNAEVYINEVTLTAGTYAQKSR
jgi:hypothetical protein